MRYADDNIKQRLSQDSRGRNSEINDLIWPVFEVVRDFIHVHLICKFQEHPVKTERDSKINYPIWLVFKRVRDFIHVQFQEVPIKTERNVVMTRYIRGFFSNQGNVTLRLMIIFGQILSLS